MHSILINRLLLIVGSLIIAFFLRGPGIPQETASLVGELFGGTLICYGLTLLITAVPYCIFKFRKRKLPAFYIWVSFSIAGAFLLGLHYWRATL